jgi:ABC-type uncharacterized transport system permease subunit
VPLWPPLFPVTLSVYAVACALYLVHVATGGQQKGIAQAARLALAVAFASHTVDIAWLCIKGKHPVASAREAVSFVSWLTAGVFFLTALRLERSILGALVVPGVLVLYLAARLAPGNEAPRSSSLLGTTHILLATAGVALFAVAAGGAAVYLVAERRLKHPKDKKALLRMGPALTTLDTFNRRCILAGFPVFTVAMITGAVWVSRLPGAGVFTVQYGIATAAWLVYAGLLLGRLVAGWRGRRAAWMTLTGFAGAMATLLIYFLRGVVGA